MEHLEAILGSLGRFFLEIPKGSFLENPRGDTVLRRPWSDHGSILGAFFDILERSWEHLEAILGTLFGILQRS